MHVATMLSMIMLASAVMAVAIAVVARRSRPELRAWAAALGLQLLGYLALALRPHVPEAVSVLLGNGLLSASLSVYGCGLYLFFKAPVQWGRLVWPVVATAALCVVWLGDFRWRVGTLSVVYLLQGLVILLLLWRHRASQQGRRGYLLLMMGMALFTSVMLTRLVLAWLDLLDITQNQQAGLFNTLTYLNSLACTMMNSVGMLMMTQERAEDLLAESERDYRQLIETANDGICIVQDSHIRFANPRMHQLFGHADGALLGTSIQDLVVAQDWPMVQANHRLRLASASNDLRYPARMHTRHAGVRWMEVSGVRIAWRGQTATLNFLNDITERKTMEETIRGLAFHDTLTQLPNRRLLLERIAQAREWSQRAGHWAGLVFLDLDRFKALNDTHGHHAGDLLLVEVARRLNGGVRSVDTVARLGGDEFVVLLAQLAEEEPQARQAALDTAHKLLAALAVPYTLDLSQPVANESAPAETPAAAQTITHHCSASAGLVVFHGHTQGAQALLDLADATMYQAKAAGRNQVYMGPSPH